MKIVIVNSFDIKGGAARAAYRLHKGLVEIGENSRMLVCRKSSSDQNVHIAKPIPLIKEESQHLQFFINNVIKSRYIQQNRSGLSNTLFTFPYPGLDISQTSLVRSADVVNLHWIDNFQSPITLRKLFDLKKPIVWTLHDEWAFTGGCHYSAGCLGYVKDCSNCPQLKDNLFNIPSVVLEDKLKLFVNTNLTIVTPSQWLSGCVKKSKLFKKFRIETVPNSLETDIFIPIPKHTAKQTLGITRQTTTILFVADIGDEKRKGFKQFIEAITFCSKDPKFQDLIMRGLVKVICFGNPNKEMEMLPMDTASLGYIEDDKNMSEAYSAADIFVLPSLEDNLPNTILESMSCGTPVVAFDTGGMPDLVEDGITGRLVPFMDTKKMGEAILDLVLHPKKRVKMGIECRKKMESEFRLTVQAKNYISLYQDLAEKSQTSTSKITQDTEKAFSFNTEEQAVKLNTTLGPGFQNSDDNILIKILLKVHYQKIAEQDTIIRNMRNSLSWRIAAPLRKLWHLLPGSFTTLCKKFFST